MLSFTEVQKPPEGFDPPLKMALVELELCATVLCLAQDDFNSAIEIGSKVILTFDEEDRLRYSKV